MSEDDVIVVTGNRPSNTITDSSSIREFMDQLRDAGGVSPSSGGGGGGGGAPVISLPSPTDPAAEQALQDIFDLIDQQIAEATSVEGVNALIDEIVVRGGQVGDSVMRFDSTGTILTGFSFIVTFNGAEGGLVVATNMFDETIVILHPTDAGLDAQRGQDLLGDMRPLLDENPPPTDFHPEELIDFWAGDEFILANTQSQSGSGYDAEYIHYVPTPGFGAEPRTFDRYEGDFHIL